MADTIDPFDPFGTDRYIRNRMSDLFGSSFDDVFSNIVSPGLMCATTGTGTTPNAPTPTGGGNQGGGRRRRKANPSFRIDVAETDQNYLVKADLPGIKKEDIHVSFNEDLLTIEAERKQELDNVSMHLAERPFGKISRSIKLPNNTNFEETKANYENGVLALTLGKKQDEKKRVIQIQ